MDEMVKFIAFLAKITVCVQSYTAMLGFDEIEENHASIFVLIFYPKVIR